MKSVWLGLAALTLASAAGAASAASAVSGDYIESRSLSVYAGACHYGGEAVTAGQEAVMAWKIKNGAWAGQNLDGLSVVAVVNGPDNLALDPNGHRTLLYVDQSASPKQRDALVNLLATNYGKVLGDVVAVKSDAVKFDMKDKSYRVRVPGSVYVAADKYPCAKCVMPHQVWYEPFVPVTDAQVAHTVRTEFKASVPNFSTWNKMDADSVYIGEFTL
jgi:hypothetical protein